MARAHCFLRWWYAALSILLTLTPAATAETAAPAERVFAVRTLGDDGSLAAAVEGLPFFRPDTDWLQGWRGEVGPEPHGDLEVLVGLLPLPATVQKRIAMLPVTLDREVRFAGTSYDHPELAIALRLPETDRPRWLVCAYQTEPVVNLTKLVLAKELGLHFRPGIETAQPIDYVLREHPWLLRHGRWRQDGERYVVEAASDEDGFAARHHWHAGLRPIEAGPIRLLVAPGQETRAELRALAQDLAATARTAALRLPHELSTPIEVALEDDYLSQGRHTGAIGEAVMAEAGQPPGLADLHLVYHPDDIDAHRYALAHHLVTRTEALAALPPWLARGAALWISARWLGRPYGEWLPILAAADVLPSAAELLASERQGDSSELIFTPVAAAVVAALPGTTLTAKLRTVPDEKAIATALATLMQRAAPPANTAAAPLPPGFLKGVSLAMQIGIEGGYHAPSAGHELARLRQLGANAISLMPFAFQRATDRPAMHFLNRSPSSETDIGLLHAARSADAQGFRVLWKPHVWSRGWSGEIVMDSEADWQAWWHIYRRFLIHHALLARHASAEGLSLGVELGKTLHREREWRQLIRAVRLVFPGPLTYAANWWDDAERVGFWDALDFIGVDAYYPLAATAEASPEALRRGAREVGEKLAALAARHGKPLVLTEVGFAAREAAWVQPHEEGGVHAPEDQATAYAALFDGLGRPPWLAGLFVWKAFSFGHQQTSPIPDFRFLGRPAEAVIRDYFSMPTTAQP